MQGLAEIPMFPLGWPYLPSDRVVLKVFEPRYVALMREIESRPVEIGKGFGTVMIERGSEVGGGDSRLNFGVMIEVQQIRWAGRDRAAMFGKATNVIEVLNWRADDPFPRAVVEIRDNDDGPLDGPMAIAFASATKAVHDLRTLAFEAGFALDPTLEVGVLSERASNSVWSLCAAAPLGELDRFRLLRTPDATDRLRILELMCLQLSDTYRFGR